MTGPDGGSTASLEALIATARRALVLGIGGGGDAVGALAVARRLEARGLEFVLGGVAWERFAVDPYPGPRPLAHIQGGERVAETALLIDPAEGARTPEGVHFCESRMAGFLGSPTVLIDITAGPEGASAGIEAAAARLGCDLVALVDIGGDAIAEGGEPGLASPLCDAVMIAAGAALPAARSRFLAVLGAGCDGELTPREVSARVAALARAGAWLDTLGVSGPIAEEIERAATTAVTEASLLVARAARGAVGETEIRGGLRTVELGPLAALAFCFDLERALAELPLVRAVQGAADIEDARSRLEVLGVRTELDYERDRARAAG
ncbi:MAG TPA: DUF1152 domain-containing protein [Solirubrobacterales bacterium]